MSQNRNKLIELFISNISNVVVHRILEKAIDNIEIINHYVKEIKNSFEIAKKYREKINPIHIPLPNKDRVYIKNKIINKVRNELLLRISRGYTNINLDLIEQFVDNALRETDIV